MARGSVVLAGTGELGNEKHVNSNLFKKKQQSQSTQTTISTISHTSKLYHSIAIFNTILIKHILYIADAVCYMH